MNGDRHLRRDPDGRLGGSPPTLAIVLVKANVDAATTVTGQHLLQMLINLLARQFGVIAQILLDVDDVPLEHGVFLQPSPGSGSLRSALLHLSGSVGDDEITIEQATEASRPTVMIDVGGELDPRAQAVPTIAVSGNGWRAFAHTDAAVPAFESASSNPLGAHLAACVAAGFAFKSAYGKQRPVNASLDLWRGADQNGPELEGIELPAAYVLGLGAVGAAFGFTLASARGLKGTLMAVDPQSVADTDLNRLLTAIRSSVGEPKEALFKRLFVGSQMAVHTFRGKWPQDYLGDPARDAPAQLEVDEDAGRYRWIISCVDRNRDRANIAARLPLHILSGSTLGLAAQTAYFSLHGSCECLACRHRTPAQVGVEELANQLRNLDRDARQVWYGEHGASYEQQAAIEECLVSPTCSGPGEADLTRLGVQGRVDWAVGFVSAAAGVILAARFIRMALRGVESELSSGSEERLLFWADELLHSRAQRLPDCPICGGALESQWTGLWSATRGANT